MLGYLILNKGDGMQFIMMMMVMLLSVPVWAADLKVEAGKKISADYTLTVDNEEVETSAGSEPLQFIVGDATIIPGLEQKMMGMHVGEERIIEVESNDAYGDVDPQAVKEFPKASLAQGVAPTVGMVLQAKAPDGEEFPAVIKELKEDKMILDFNHPLAGKKLKFKVKVNAIEDAPAIPEVKAEEEVAPIAPVSPEAAK